MPTSALGHLAALYPDRARAKMRAAHDKTGGDVSKAAKALGISRRGWYVIAAALALDLPSARGGGAGASAHSAAQAGAQSGTHKKSA